MGVLWRCGYECVGKGVGVQCLRGGDWCMREFNSGDGSGDGSGDVSGDGRGMTDGGECVCGEWRLVWGGGWAVSVYDCLGFYDLVFGDVGFSCSPTRQAPRH